MGLEGLEGGGGKTFLGETKKRTWCLGLTKSRKEEARKNGRGCCGADNRSKKIPFADQGRKG